MATVIPEIDVGSVEPIRRIQKRRRIDPKSRNGSSLQQNIELKKAPLGKEGDVVDKITQDRDQSDPLEDVDDGKNKLVGVDIRWRRCPED